MQAYQYSWEHKVPLIAFSGDRCLTLFDHPLVDSLHTTYHEPKVPDISFSQNTILLLMSHFFTKDFYRQRSYLLLRISWQLLTYRYIWIQNLMLIGNLILPLLGCTYIFNLLFSLSNAEKRKWIYRIVESKHLANSWHHCVAGIDWLVTFSRK